MAAAIICNAEIASKYRGCMIGVLMGDCLGRPFEFHTLVTKTIWNDYISNLMDIQTTRILLYTDDTCMTLSVASSLVEKGKLDSKDMAKKFVADYFNQPNRGYGSHITYVFQALRKTKCKDVFLPAKTQFFGEGSYGNGAAMRIAPIALFGNSKGEDYIMKSTEECARITHAHANGYNGAILQCLAVNTALGLDSSQDLDPVNFIDNLLEKMEKVEMECADKPYCDILKKMRDVYLPKQEDLSGDEIAIYLGRDISALRSVPTAIYSFLRGMKPLNGYEETNPFIRTLCFALSVGGDTDTIASMALSIAGAYYGADIIPEILQKRCESVDKIIKLADELFDASQKK